MGVGGPAGRLVELGERERRAQCEAARALLACDGEGRSKGFLSGRRIRLFAPEKDLAADAVSLRLESSLSSAFNLNPAVGEDNPVISSA